VSKPRPEWINRALAEHPKQEIFPIDEGGERFWLKRGRPTGSTKIHHLGYRLTGLPFLRPVEAKSSVEAIRHEATKLRKLYDQGLPVPEPVWMEESFFVMKDTGETLAELLKSADRTKGDRWLAGVVESLAALHRAGEYHGASQIRNFTLDTRERVHIIDFEESFPEESDLKALQFRDLFLLLYSLHRQRYETDYPALLAVYMERSGNREFGGELRALYRRFRWLAALVEPFWVRRKLGSDAEILHRLFESLKG
jgi:tRNA A-37 threonylcarbamoyl transferase component Bud32